MLSLCKYINNPFFFSVFMHETEENNPAALLRRNDVIYNSKSATNDHYRIIDFLGKVCFFF